ncbi:hypothetical protein [Deinococcus altitudinis]|uniref:DUF5691 domain-containing protein n=1 Tax=Deinococcus altitudinis TaxID=468914 RepID=UPI0038914D21
MSGPEREPEQGQASDLTQLGAAARRGTSRTGLPDPAPTPLGHALTRVQRDTLEATLLARAALAGLHAQAGRTPGGPTSPAPQFVAAGSGAAAISPLLEDLLSVLAQRPEVLREALTLLRSTGRRLNAVQARSLLALNDGGGDPLAGTLWPTLNEHARWLVRLHPVWKRQDPETLPASVQLANLRRELVEAHAAEPETAAQDAVARWPALKADERRVALEAAAGSLHQADWPMVRLAINDKLPDVRRRALLLQGHLPGAVREEVRAALPTWFVRVKGRLKVVRGQAVEALGQPEANTTADGELHRLLGAWPTAELPALLGATLAEILDALKKYPDHLGSPASEYRGQKVIEDMERGAAGADLDALLASETSLGRLLPYWPQRRIQALLWEAVTRLLGPPELDGTLMRTTLTLFAALEEPLPLAPETQAAPRKGLLARVVSALGRPQAHDWPTLLNALSERLLLALSREISSYPLPLSPLLEAVAIHLDPARPVPSGPQPQMPPDLPEGASKKAQEAHTVALIRYNQHTHGQAALTHTLTLRRQVHAALAGDW